MENLVMYGLIKIWWIFPFAFVFSLVAAIKEAVKDGKPLYERVVTVTGDAIKNPSNFKVRTGTNVQELIEAAGGFKTQPEKIISGGPMMGMAMFTTDVPAVKTFSCFLAFTKDEVAANQPSNCIRCGRCVSVCPQKLMPAKTLNWLVGVVYAR